MSNSEKLRTIDYTPEEVFNLVFQTPREVITQECQADRNNCPDFGYAACHRCELAKTDQRAIFKFFQKKGVVIEGIKVILEISNLKTLLTQVLLQGNECQLEIKHSAHGGLGGTTQVTASVGYSRSRLK